MSQPIVGIFRGTYDDVVGDTRWQSFTTSGFSSFRKWLHCAREFVREHLTECLPRPQEPPNSDYSALAGRELTQLAANSIHSRSGGRSRGPHEGPEWQCSRKERHQEIERDDTSAAYTHAQYLEPRARMMQAWTAYLERLREQGEATDQEAA